MGEPIRFLVFQKNTTKFLLIKIICQGLAEKQTQQNTYIYYYHFCYVHYFLQPVKTHNIHHFCTMPSRVELPPHLCKLMRDEHTRDRFHQAGGKQMDANFKVHAQYMLFCNLSTVAWQVTFAFKFSGHQTGSGVSGFFSMKQVLPG